MKNITLSVDDQLLERVREKLRASGKTVNQEIRDHFRHITGETNLDEEIEAFRKRAGQGNSNGWKWNREDAYEGRLEWPRQ
jgi:hypothetical protein